MQCIPREFTAAEIAGQAPDAQTGVDRCPDGKSIFPNLLVRLCVSESVAKLIWGIIGGTEYSALNTQC